MNLGIYNYENMQAIYTRFVVSNYPKFEIQLKPKQAEVIHASLCKKDVLALLPTAFGKSLCIYAPAIINHKVTGLKTAAIIISPLIALAAEQEFTLRSRGLKVINCIGNDSESSLKILASAGNEDLLFILCSPEILRLEKFREFLVSLSTCFLIVDEGHCVSDWGDDFRASYSCIYELRAFIRSPLSVFTATLTPSMRSAVLNATGLITDNMYEYSGSPNRPEIFLNVLRKEKGYSSLQHVVDDVKSHGKTAKKILIYTQTVSAAKNILLWIRARLPNLGRVIMNDSQSFEYNVDMYHGNTNDDSQCRIREEFTKEESYVKILVATVAFGMGVNISHLYDVIIWDVDDEVASLMQKIGRCSRDGKKGTATIFLPTVPSPGSLSHELTSGCVRKAIVSKFCGWIDQVTPTVDHRNCTIQNCNCVLCACCCFCKEKCNCKSD